MADYWVSQPRKFCDFCKCWIADNKPSRDFHEKGKNHLQNVKKKISLMMKTSAEKAVKDEEFEQTIKKMEQEAMRSLKKDLQKDPNLAVQYGVKLKAKAEEKPEETSNQQPGTSQSTVTAENSSKNSTDESESDPNLLWKEEWTPEGFVYYWNTSTGETNWEKPKGYTPTWEREVKKQLEEQSTDKVEFEFEPVTPAEQSESVVADSSPPSPSLDEVTPPKEVITKTTDTKSSESNTEKEIPVDIKDKPDSKEAIHPEPVFSLSSIPLPEPVSAHPDDEEGGLGSIPLPKSQSRPVHTKPHSTSSAYGNWQTVQNEEDEPIDLQLPEQQVPNTEVHTISVSEPKIKFRQKKVDTLGAEFVAFKKRKMNASVRKENMRKTDTERD